MTIYIRVVAPVVRVIALRAGALAPADVSLTAEFADISDVIDRKIRAIALYESQIERLFGDRRRVPARVLVGVRRQLRRLRPGTCESELVHAGRERQRRRDRLTAADALAAAQQRCTKEPLEIGMAITAQSASKSATVQRWMLGVLYHS